MGKSILIDSQIATKWIDTPKHKIPLPEYPRPQLHRPEWINLNGEWNYSITGADEPCPVNFSETILVPYAIETALSGVGRQMLPHERLWYRRELKIPEEWTDGRILLHFERVDWECEVFIDDISVGLNHGGYLPFRFDVTNIVQFVPGQKRHTLTIVVHDPTDTHWQQSGLQKINPGVLDGYHQSSSGIYGTVWLEHVADAYISDIRITPDINSGEVEIVPVLVGNGMVVVSVTENGEKLAEGKTKPGVPLRLPIPYMKVWSPENPYLYGLELVVMERRKKLDRVSSYFAMCKISVRPDKSGLNRITINDMPCFLNGVLYKGYWPESGLTPPADGAMIEEITRVKELGFNCIRMYNHIALRRWYSHCDRMGLLIMQDMVSGGSCLVKKEPALWSDPVHKKVEDTTEKSIQQAARDTQESRNCFTSELRIMIITLVNNPSICIWNLFTNGRGQYQSAELSEMVKQYDPGRLVSPVSGIFDQGGGDIAGLRTYGRHLPPEKHESRVLVISEYGGVRQAAADHLWKPDMAGTRQYRKMGMRQSVYRELSGVVQKSLRPMLKYGLSGAIYAQLTDVEDEYDGLITYDRKLIKFSVEEIREMNRRLEQEFLELV